MDIEIKVVTQHGSTSDTVSLSLPPNQTIGDIQKELIKNNHIDVDSQHQYLFFHSNSGLLFSDDITLQQCTDRLSLSQNDTLSLHLAKLIDPKPPRSSNGDTEQKSDIVPETDSISNLNDAQNTDQSTAQSATEYESTIQSLKSEIERLQFSATE